MGKTIQEVKSNMLEALSLHLASLREENEPVPKPESVPEYLDVPELASEADAPGGSFEDAVAYFEDHRQALLKTYEGKYIAIIDRQVVDSDSSWEALALRVYTRYGYKDIFMPKVEQHAQTVHIYSPRLR